MIIYIYIYVINLYIYRDMKYSIIQDVLLYQQSYRTLLNDAERERDGRVFVCIK